MPSMGTQSDSARAALEALFGIDRAEKEQESPRGSHPGSESERTRRELESLFGVTKKPQSEHDAQSDSD